MFRPDSNRDRTDYSGILMPPDGYRLDRAVGTTYSLDLEALTAVAICLGLSEETDSKLMQNPIGMLNALQKVSDKIVLFCEAGQIKVPTKPTALSILLEKMVVEVALPKDRQLGRYPAFHPKTWILAYVNAEGDKKYRFVVMSRNLTFDRSWDISFAMDSSKNVRQKKKTQPICDFLDYLVTNVHNTSNNAGKKRNLIRGLCADIKDVSFSLDSKIFGEDFEVLPLGIGKNAYRMQEDILFCKERGNANSTFNELVVMSPFLSESVIADFNLTDRALSDCKRTLVTRRSELGKLKASDVDNFTIYALKDEIIDGEDEISDELADKKKQDIHAKIYLRRKYSDVDLYLGSMNASYSAINKNVEMMLWLGTKNMYLNGNKFLEDIFCGPAGDVKNPFEEVTVADAVLETESDNRDLLEQKIKDAYELVNFNGRAFRNAVITPEYLAARLEELKWGVRAQELKAQAQEEQRRLREQIREEERARREYEKAMKDAAKEEEMLRKAMEKAQKQIESANEANRAEYESKLEELKQKLAEAEERGQRALSMAQQTKHGNVYVISNLGSFGENVYKVGMTRRLDPLDRVRELGDASVPFPFDVHAIIESDDAPSLETSLHKALSLMQVNKVNPRKEFFRVAISDIKAMVEKMGLTTSWTMDAAAAEYRETLAIEDAMKNDPDAKRRWEEYNAAVTSQAGSTSDDEDAQ